MNYPFSTTVTVTFRDLDALGHVNNAVYLTYIESARIAYLLELFGSRDLRDLAVILAETTISYRSPAHYGEVLTVACGIGRLGTKSFTMHVAITAQDGRLVALARNILVMYDYATGASAPISDAFRERIEDRQGDWAAPDDV